MNSFDDAKPSHRHSLGRLIGSWQRQPGADDPETLFDIILQAFWSHDLPRDAIVINWRRYAEANFVQRKLPDGTTEQLDMVGTNEVSDSDPLLPWVLIEQLRSLGSPAANECVRLNDTAPLARATHHTYGPEAVEFMKANLDVQIEAILNWSIETAGLENGPSVAFMQRDPVTGEFKLSANQKSRVSLGSLRRWYRDEYIPKMQALGKRPSWKDDLAAARAKFGPAATQERVRQVRREEAPADWKKGGRPKRKQPD